MPGFVYDRIRFGEFGAVLIMPDWVEKPGDQESVLTENKQKLEKPPKYKVLLHNDDFTSMEFVVLVLTTIFHKNPIAAYRIMMAVHQQGIGVAGVYTYEIAEAKVTKVTKLAREHEFPLLCTIEEE